MHILIRKIKRKRRGLNGREREEEEEDKDAYLSSNRMNISRPAFVSRKCTIPRPTDKVTLEESSKCFIVFKLALSSAVALYTV
jgi:hypothetical protein